MPTDNAVPPRAAAQKSRRLASLKARLALGVGVFIFLMLGVDAVVQTVALRPEQQALVKGQLRILTTQIADSLDDKLALRRNALESSALHFPRTLLGSPQAMAAYLEKRRAMLTLFDDLYVFSPDGRLLVDWPPIPGRRGLDMSDRDYIRAVVATRQTAISQPNLGRITRQPQIAMAAPILDDDGNLLAIFAGIINLFRNDMLGDLRSLKIGQDGFALLTHANGRVIAHPDPERLLKVLPEPEKRLLPAAEAPLSEAVRTVALPERPAYLVAQRRLQSTGWLLTTLYPLDEAMAPLTRMSRETFMIAVLIGLFAVPIVWLLADRLLRPLDRLKEAIAALAGSLAGENDRPALPAARVPEDGPDEIASLARAFNAFQARIEAAERCNRVHERRLELVLETASDGIWDWDLAHNDFLGNKALAAMLGLEQQGPVATTPRQIATHLIDEERPAVRRAIIDCLKGKTDIYRSEHRLRRADGRIIWVLERGRVVERAADGSALRLVGSFTDITQQKQDEERIREMAFYDALTGLPNRIQLAERTQALMREARQKGEPLALLFVDLDHFKNINDSLGHFTGDLLLQAAARRLAQVVDGQGLVSRLGGDEFVVVLPGADADRASECARRILIEGGKAYRVEERLLTVTPSIGICIFPEDAGDFETLLRHADIAMYRAKENGRNAFCFFTPEMNEAACQRLELESALREALERGEFLLHYQPQIDIASGRLVGVEALARWQSPRLGMVPPAQFIPVAEDSGLIAPLGEFVLRTACQQARALQDAGLPPLVMAVNLSGAQFRLPNLPSTVAGILEESGLAPQWLELELTEGVLMDDTVNASQMLQRLKAMGVRLAIDDFGTGYSSLAYLKQFPLDKLKVDRSFVTDLEQDMQDQAIIRAIIGLAHSLGMTVIAEGVETLAQLEHLGRDGCDEYQGYLCARPMSAEALRDWIRGTRPHTHPSPA